MSRLPILTLPDARLRQRSQEIDPTELKKPEFQAWLDDLLETMRLADGVGIAAPQVGQAVRVFIAMDGDKVHYVVNPVVTRKSWSREDGEEGCLSVPGKYGLVKRYRSFTVSALDRHGKKIMLAGKRFFARVLQHELDHLDGVLYVDRAKKIFEVQL